MMSIFPGNARLRGFTLIEILVVVGISMVLGTMVLARYNDFNDRQRVLRSADLFATDLRRVQRQAESGELNGCGSDGLDRFVVTADAAGPDARVVAQCVGGGEVSGSDITLAHGLTFQDSYTIEFASVTGISSGSIDIVLVGNGNCSQTIVSVTPSGSIEPSGVCIN